MWQLYNGLHITEPYSNLDLTNAEYKVKNDSRNASIIFEIIYNY